MNLNFKSFQKKFVGNSYIIKVSDSAWYLHKIYADTFKELSGSQDPLKQ